MNSNSVTYVKKLTDLYDSVKVETLKNRRFPPGVFFSVIDDIVKKSDRELNIRHVGTSFEGMPIRLVTVGTGKTSILLWSQMHGDEPTATMAIADILNYFLRHRNDEEIQKIFSSLTLHFLPLLNPDGAARFQRRTAQEIDMNRDALALVTPEAKILKQIQDDLKPQFGFNLHDQELSTVGASKELTAIALLAPAFNPEKSDNDVRTRAKHLTALFASVMNNFVSGKVARYDDTFEPRAFGDNMQKWGTSTLLVESGHAMNDPEKHSIRKLNFIGLLSSFLSIATDEYRTSDIALYESLPLNGKRAYDVIIRNVLIESGNGTTTSADLGISYQVDTHSELPPKLVDLGDLHTFVGLQELDGKKKKVHQARLNEPFEWEKLYL
jgi:hypothetical protein